jgi:hypothetical protein
VDTAWLADLAIALHAGYLVFLVVGGFLAWRWPRVLWAHLVAAVWALGIVTVGQPCPLTDLERHFRPSVGQRGFIDRHVEGVVYPEGHTTTARIAVAVLVTVSYAGLVHRRRRDGER